MASLTDLINLNLSDSTEEIIAEYIWIGGPGMDLRSKARTLSGPVSDPSKLPKWNYDGSSSSTGQALGEDSEVTLYPQAIFKDPFRKVNSILVMCDSPDGEPEPLPTNYRAAAAEILSNPEVAAEEPWYGIEQEYTLLQNQKDTKWPLGWPLGGFPGPQAIPTAKAAMISSNSNSNQAPCHGIEQEYTPLQKDTNRPVGRPLGGFPGPKGPLDYNRCIGANKSFGPDIVYSHYNACQYAGINISGIGEVMPGQWKFKVGPAIGISAVDQICVARYILERITEIAGVGLTFDDPKPTILGDHTLGSLIPALPDDLAVNCIALLPRAYHRSLAPVSRAFHSHLYVHPEQLLAARRCLGISNAVILLSLRPPSSTSLVFYLLDPYSGRLTPLPSPLMPTSFTSSVATDGRRLFVVGGSVQGVPSTSLQILDIPTRSWSAGPHLSAPREKAAAVVQSGTLFVIGGCAPSSPAWAESLDLASPDATWVQVSSPPSLRKNEMRGSASLAGKVLAVAGRLRGEGALAYDPAVGAWVPVSQVLNKGWSGSAAVVGEILYSYNSSRREVKGYDPGSDWWTVVEGLERELPIMWCVSHANVEGLLHVSLGGEI